MGRGVWDAAVAGHRGYPGVGYCASGDFRSCAVRWSGEAGRPASSTARIIAPQIDAIRGGHAPLLADWWARARGGASRAPIGRAAWNRRGAAGRSGACLNKIGRPKSSGVHSLTGLHPHGTQRDRETSRDRGE